MAIGTPVSIGSFGLNPGTSANISFPLSGAVNANDLVVVAVGTIQRTTPSTVSAISDGPNTYSKAVGQVDATPVLNTEIWRVEGAAAVASGTLALTMSDVPDGISVGVWSVPGCNGSGALDKTASSGVASTHPSISSGALSQADEILFGALTGGNSETYTESSGFTNLRNDLHDVRLGVGYQIVSSTNSVTYSPTVSVGVHESTVLASFRGQSSFVPFSLTPIYGPLLAQLKAFVGWRRRGPLWTPPELWLPGKPGFAL